MYPRGIRAEQKSYGFKNLEKSWRIWNPRAQKPIGSREQCAHKPIQLESSVLINQYNKRAVFWTIFRIFNAENQPNAA